MKKTLDMLRISAEKVENMLQEETKLFEKNNKKSKEMYAETKNNYIRGVPMHWMANWPTPYPMFYKTAKGIDVEDVDGNNYYDFCLGDTGAMYGHGNEHIVETVQEQIGKGSTVMFPSEEAIYIGKELEKRFGLPYWQLSTSATDANRFAIRISRIFTGRDKILVFNGKYHGSIDETQVALDKEGEMIPQPQISINATDYDKTTKIVEFNDIEALEKALEERDVACVLAEPIMTNVGVVPADEGYHEKLREITKRTGTLLIIDETHTISTSPSGYTGMYNLKPDIFVLGKAIAGGIPAAVYGMSKEIADTFLSYTEKKDYQISHNGIGGTLAGNVLTVSAMKTTLEKVMTEENYKHMYEMARLFEKGVQDVIDKYELSWHVFRIGARVEYMFGKEVPRNGSEAKAMRHPKLEAVLHLYMLNRGVLMTPFHNMAIMCPYTTEESIEKHTELFEDVVRSLIIV